MFQNCFHKGETILLDFIEDTLERMLSKLEKLGQRLQLDFYGAMALIVNIFLTIISCIYVVQWPKEFSVWNSVFIFFKEYLNNFGYAIIGSYVFMVCLNVVILVIALIADEIEICRARREGIRAMAEKAKAIDKE